MVYFLHTFLSFNKMLPLPLLSYSSNSTSRTLKEFELFAELPFAISKIKSFRKILSKILQRPLRRRAGIISSVFRWENKWKKKKEQGEENCFFLCCSGIAWIFPFVSSYFNILFFIRVLYSSFIRVIYRMYFQSFCNSVRKRNAVMSS